MKRDLVEINRKAPQWSHNAVWNKKYMEPKPGFTLQQLWTNSESAIAQKTSPSYEVRTVTYAGPSRPLQQCPLPHCPIVHSSRHWEPSGGLEISLLKARVMARGRNLIIKIKHLLKDVTPHADFACLYFLYRVGREDMVCNSLQRLMLFDRYV